MRRKTDREAGASESQAPGLELDLFFRSLMEAADAAYRGPGELPAQPLATGWRRYRFLLESVAAAAVIVLSGAWLASRIAEFSFMLGEFLIFFAA